jgi:hypothetical protein
MPYSAYQTGQLFPIGQQPPLERRAHTRHTGLTTALPSAQRRPFQNAWQSAQCRDARQNHYHGASASVALPLPFMPNPWRRCLRSAAPPRPGSCPDTAFQRRRLFYVAAIRRHPRRICGCALYPRVRRHPRRTSSKTLRRAAPTARQISVFLPKAHTRQVSRAPAERETIPVKWDT